MAFDLTQTIDLHVHTAPDVYHRRVDDLELADQAKRLGMRAILIKSHHTLTADRATLSAKHTGMQVFGGLALNHTVGGFNPVAVETAIAFGAKQIWMPTIHAAHCLRVARPEMFRAEARKGRVGLTVLDENGAISEPVKVILEMIRDAGIILGTGHIAPAESLALLQTARDMGMSKLLVTHPNMAFTSFTLQQMHDAVDLGALLEFDYLSCSPNWEDAVDPDRTAQAISQIGPEHCVLSTDGGQHFNPDPPKMLAQFADTLIERGVTPEGLRTMMQDNPARLLDLGLT